MKVLIFYGSLFEFNKHIPDRDIVSVVDLAIKDDDERRKFKVKMPGQEEEEQEAV